ncbi:hypothetical protein AcV7_000220 [Taiwanofungus camphoratus]|nr:hypothetical protein AcV7_000220 [Antrodia cinnamomea]
MDGIVEGVQLTGEVSSGLARQAPLSSIRPSGSQGTGQSRLRARGSQSPSHSHIAQLYCRTLPGATESDTYNTHNPTPRRQMTTSTSHRATLVIRDGVLDTHAATLSSTAISPR